MPMNWFPSCTLSARFTKSWIFLEWSWEILPSKICLGSDTFGTFSGTRHGLYDMRRPKVPSATPKGATVVQTQLSFRVGLVETC